MRRGCPRGPRRTGSWESEGLGGQTGGHYLSALSYLWAATGAPRPAASDSTTCSASSPGRRMRTAPAMSAGCPGARRCSRRVAAGGPAAARAFGESPNWVPWYNLHKTFQGLIDAYTVGGQDRALDMVTRLADWWLAIAARRRRRDVRDDARHRVRRHERGRSRASAMITGRDDFAAMALRFSHRAILDPLRDGRDALTGLHANTQIPKAVGYGDLAEIAGIRRRRRRLLAHGRRQSHRP